MQILKGRDIIMRIIKRIIAKFINISVMEPRRFCCLVCIVQKSEAELHSVHVGHVAPLGQVSLH